MLRKAQLRITCCRFACVFNREYLFITREQSGNSLYYYPSRDQANLLDSHPKPASEMKRYAESMFQTTQWMFDNPLAKYIRLF